MGAMYAEHYCRGDCSMCARHQLTAQLGSLAVPPSLYPNDHDKAQVIFEREARPRAPAD